jgi:tetratricopeptide (TPR) repeat protein
MPGRAALTSCAVMFLAFGPATVPRVSAQTAPAPPSIPPPRTRAVDAVAKAYLELGKALFNAKEWNLAIENLTKALERSDELSEARLYLAGSFIQTKTYRAAEENLLKLATDPKFGSKQRVHSSLGNLYLVQKEYEKAVNEFKRAYELDPAPMRANDLAYAYILGGANLEESLRLVNQALEATPLGHALTGYYLDTRATAYTQMKRYSEAEKDALESIKIGEQFQPDRVPDRRYRLGEIYLKAKKPDLARREFQRVLTLDRNHEEAAKALRRLN